MTLEKRQHAFRAGQWAERAVAIFLQAKGYAILARGFRVPQGEIDIVARRGPTLCFVEVKYRPNRSAAAAAISRRQQRRIIQAAQAFLMRNPALSCHEQRFDAVLVTRWGWPRHLRGAWQAGPGGQGVNET